MFKGSEKRVGLLKNLRSVKSGQKCLMSILPLGNRNFYPFMPDSFHVNLFNNFVDIYRLPTIWYVLFHMVENTGNCTIDLTFCSQDRHKQGGVGRRCGGMVGAAESSRRGKRSQVSWG